MNEYDQEYLLELGRNIRNARQKKGMTQQEVANNCRIHRSRIGKIENGQIEVQHMTLVEIATAMGVELSTLLPSNLDLDLKKQPK